VEKCGKHAGRDGELGPGPHPVRTDGSPGEREWMAVRACSACAGDYEDPERTAEMFDEADEEEHGEALDAVTEEFPADSR
jgi:hypothetical protein